MSRRSVRKRRHLEGKWEHVPGSVKVTSTHEATVTHPSGGQVFTQLDIDELQRYVNGKCYTV